MKNKANIILVIFLTLAFVAGSAFSDRLDDKKKAIEKFKEAEIEYQQGDYYAAVKLYKKSVSLDPENSEALYNIGVCYIELKDEDNAFDYFKKTIETDPDHPGAHYNIGRLFQLRKDFETATLEYKRALKRDPYAVDVLYNLAIAQSENGEIDNAIDTWDRYISIAENDPNEENWVGKAREFRENLLSIKETEIGTSSGE